MLLELHGLSVSAICRAVGMRRSQVGAVVNSILYRRERDRLQRRLEAEALAQEGALRAKLDQLARRGAIELEGLLGGPETPARLRAEIAMDLLDRGGFKSVDRHEVTIDYATLIQRAYERRLAMRRGQDSPALILEALPAPKGPSGER
jgi:hypothetical protein